MRRTSLLGSWQISLEILSLGQGAATYDQRCQWHLEQGVQIALVVNPRNESVKLFRPHREVTLLVGDDSIDFDPVLPGLQLTVRGLFASLRFQE